MKKLSNYETIRSFYYRLSAQNPETIFYGTGIRLAYGIAKFEGKNKQSDKSSFKHKDNWNFLDIDVDEKHGKSISTGELCNALRAFLDEHGSKPILLDRRLIKLSKDTPYKPKVETDCLFRETDMNPYMKFEEEFAEVSRVLKDTPELILGWLKKKTPAGIQVFVVGTEYYIGQDELFKQFPRLESLDDFKPIFEQDPNCVSVYTCKFCHDTIKLLFGRIVVDFFLKHVG